MKELKSATAMNSQAVQFGRRLDENPTFCFLLLVVIAGLLLFPRLGTRDSWTPGEPIYGEVIRVMFEKRMTG